MTFTRRASHWKGIIILKEASEINPLSDRLALHLAQAIMFSPTRAYLS
jgi:hypothetical protein